ncbi:hypothetical protein ACET3Z_025747 [Daucus carota]
MASSMTSSVAPSEYKNSPPRATATTSKQSAVVEVVLRVLLFLGSLTAVVIYGYAGLCKQDKTGLYSIITTLLSISALSKPVYSKILALYVVAMDVVMLAIVAAALGTAVGVAYVGLRGNSHTRWTKICNIYDTFCQQAAGAIIVPSFVATLLIMLILHSVFTMYRKIPN